MTRGKTLHRTEFLAAVLLSGWLGTASATPATDEASARAARHAAVIAHWTPERRRAALPRDLRIDARGLGYLRRADGSLEPYGHTVAALAPTPRAKPGGGGSDTTAPSISGMDPGTGATIGASYTFKATVSDASGVRSVSFVLRNPSNQTQTVAATQGDNNLWSASLSGFTDGPWTWYVVAKDNAARGGNTATSPEQAFTVGGAGGGGGGGGPVTNAQWTGGGTVQTAAGRILFEMPSNSKRTRWAAYVCSGTVVSDGTSGRSLILTAAHCVYDDANKAFARNVLFIPDQDGTGGTGTDRNCENDPLGCWTPAFGVVDDDWTTRTFPDNIAWDYAFYVVSDSGAHTGTAVGYAALDLAAGDLAVQFTAPTQGNLTHALGYSYSDDPNFMYCAETMGTNGSANWWLPSCELSGGSSGGPWMQPVNSGNGPVISVNSWGYTTSPGMAGPRLNGTSAQCIYGTAATANFELVPTGAGNAGFKPACP
jgi:hypothetical protein